MRLCDNNQREREERGVCACTVQCRWSSLHSRNQDLPVVSLAVPVTLDDATEVGITACHLNFRLDLGPLIDTFRAGIVISDCITAWIHCDIVLLKCTLGLFLFLFY